MLLIPFITYSILLLSLSYGQALRSGTLPFTFSKQETLKIKKFQNQVLFRQVQHSFYKNQRTFMTFLMT